MTIMKMFMVLVVAAVLFCDHHRVTLAREVAIVMIDDKNELQSSLCQYWPWPWSWPWPQPCPPPRPRPRPRPRPCAPPPPPPSPSPPPPSPPPKPSCSTSDQEQVKTCMFNTTSIDVCCPTFNRILGTSCPCYKYAEDLDNQVLITLQAYCDVDSPCSGVQVIKLSKDDE